MFWQQQSELHIACVCVEVEKGFILLSIQMNLL